MIDLKHIDCMEYLKTLEDNAFDLAIVDPPYGIGASKVSKKKHAIKQSNGKITNTPNNNYKNKDWDNKTPNKIYFNELFRVSKNQIIWGVNSLIFLYNFCSAPTSFLG